MEKSEPSKEVLPNDVLGLVFSRLSLKDLTAASLVCKQWSRVASSGYLFLIKKISLRILDGIKDQPLAKDDLLAIVDKIDTWGSFETGAAMKFLTRRQYQWVQSFDLGSCDFRISLGLKNKVSSTFDVTSPEIQKLVIFYQVETIHIEIRSDRLTAPQRIILSHVWHHLKAKKEKLNFKISQAD